MSQPAGVPPTDPVEWADARTRAQVLPRLYPVPDDERAADGTPEGVLALPGLLARPVREQPGVGTAQLGPADLEALGGGDAALSLALSNLRALPRPSVSDVVADFDRDDATFHQLHFEHFFGASYVLVLGELLGSMGVELPAHGAFVAVPARQVVLLHVPRGEGMVSALRVMVRRSLALHERGPAPLSPHVFHVRALEAAVQVTRFDERGGAALQASDSLRRTLVGLGLIAPQG